MNFEDNFNTVNEEEFVISKSALASGAMVFIKRNAEATKNVLEEIDKATNVVELIACTKGSMLAATVAIALEEQIADNYDYSFEAFKKRMKNADLTPIKQAAHEKAADIFRAYRYFENHLDKLAGYLGNSIVEMVNNMAMVLGDDDKNESNIEFHFYESLFCVADAIAHGIEGCRTDDEIESKIKDEFDSEESLMTSKWLNYDIIEDEEGYDDESDETQIGIVGGAIDEATYNILRALSMNGPIIHKDEDGNIIELGAVNLGDDDSDGMDDIFNNEFDESDSEEDNESDESDEDNTKNKNNN